MAYCILKMRTYENKAALHNIQVEHKRTKEYSDVMNELSFLNENLTEENNYTEMYNKALKNDYYQKPDKYGRKHLEPKIKAIELMLTFSPEAEKNINLEEWKKDNVNFLKEKFKDCPMSITYHQDQTTPHIHAVIIPLTKKGKISKTSFINGKKDMYKLQDDYSEIMQKYGLERGEKKPERANRNETDNYRHLRDKNKELEETIKRRKDRLEIIESRIRKALITLSDIQTETEVQKAKLEQVRKTLKDILEDEKETVHYKTGDYMNESDELLK